MRIVFMLGKAARSEMHHTIMEEVEQHGDMLIGDYVDTYRNITTKLLMAFQWATKIKCHYVLKTDDDVYIDIPKLVTWLKGRDVKESIYGGVTYNSVVVRRKSHKHYVSPDDLSLHRYPLYCRGSMFVLSRNLIPKMVDLSKQIRRIGPDDAYIGILAQHLVLECDILLVYGDIDLFLQASRKDKNIQHQDIKYIALLIYNWGLDFIWLEILLRFLTANYWLQSSANLVIDTAFADI
ncbi:UDP-GalNAc:beta-1 [Acropora cervicornis]|uniref:Hexosyltransferase n=1 Tax=Acropora cervicornis TaxID=6130 RepID=A0AAD9Q882_ACRCE|nr:UDP-GalNAc:beta-1 [Acropora cervicornis]